MTSRACVHYADEDKSVSKLSLSELRLEYVLVFFNVSALFTLMPLLTPQKGKVAWFGALPVVLPSVARHGHGVPAATLLRTWPRKRSLCSTKTVLSNSFLGAFTQYCWCTKRPLIDCWLVGAFKLVVMCGGPDWAAPAASVVLFSKYP